MTDDEPPNPFGVKLKKRAPPKQDGEMTAAQKEIAAAKAAAAGGDGDADKAAAEKAAAEKATRKHNSNIRHVDATQHASHRKEAPNVRAASRNDQAGPGRDVSSAHGAATARTAPDASGRQQWLHRFG